MRVKLCDVTSYSKGIQINGDELVDDGKYYYINGGINPSGKWNSYNVDGNTITISEGGNSSGYINYIDEPFWCGAHCYYLYDGPKNTRYLYYALKSQQKRMFDIRSGACMPNIKKSDLGNFEFEFEQDEQKQENITSILFTVETIIQVYNKELKFLKELVKARFVEMFDEYSKIELYKIADITMGQSPSSSSYNKDGNGLPFFQGKGDYGNKYTSVSNWTTEPNKIVEKGTVLMSVRAPVGPVNIANVKCCLGRGLCGINAVEGKTNNEFLYNALKVMEEDISSKGTGSTFKAITKKDVYELLVPNVPLELQNDYSLFSQQVDKSREIIQKKIDTYQELFDKLMQEYFG